MKIFISIDNIPENTKPEEIARFFSPFLKKGLKHPISAKANTIKQYVVAQLNPEDKIISHHGVFTIEPDEVANRILKRMRRIPFQGQKVVIREFIERCWLNDRRSCKPEQTTVSTPQRRLVERRQNTLKFVNGFQVSNTSQA